MVLNYRSTLLGDRICQQKERLISRWRMMRYNGAETIKAILETRSLGVSGSVVHWQKEVLHV
jgi:hypothetical protein